ncbi:type II secretion system F family protein [Modicisalibacter tunisiensis]|nr:type II secretion system F family protein [Modicisalibacter tunisiensis]
MNVNLSDQAIVVIMVAVAVFLLVQSFMVPAFGENRQARKRLRKRLRAVADTPERRERLALLNQHRQRSSLERALGTLPGMRRLERLIDQAGRETPAYRVVLVSLTLAVVAGLLLAEWTSFPLMGAIGGIVAGALPLLKLLRERNQRLATFEEQLPDALVIMARALRAGHPFNDAMKLVAEEMPDPIGPEFRITFMEINYGGDIRLALEGLLERIGSVTVMVFVTSVLIQRETGGNLAELVEGLAAVIRERFRFHRKLKTLSAEGRLAAWILSLLPFGLAGVLSITSPDFLPMLVKDPVGRQMVMAAFVMTIIGILWMRRIVRIEV